MNNIIQIIAAVAILALGIWLGTVFEGCGAKKTNVIHTVDTLTIDTSKIIEHTPIIVKNVQMIFRDTAKGIFENTKIEFDTVRFLPDTIFRIIRDTAREAIDFHAPSWAEIGTDLFHFNVNAKAGSGFGMVFGSGLDLNASYGRFGINISPSLYYFDKFRGFVFVGATYRLFGK